MTLLIKQLKTARLGKNLTQYELSEKVGMPQSHLSKIESGKTDPQLDSLQLIAEHLDLEVVLIPKMLSTQVAALISGNTRSKPRWQVDEEDKFYE
jgi:HTH-type transcriptional regulator/antitoxin HipB